MVPTDGGTINMKNPKTIQGELQKASPHFRQITEVAALEHVVVVSRHLHPMKDRIEMLRRDASPYGVLLYTEEERFWVRVTRTCRLDELCRDVELVGGNVSNSPNEVAVSRFIAMTFVQDAGRRSGDFFSGRTTTVTSVFKALHPDDAEKVISWSPDKSDR
ncbi:uncharacterized protein LOC142575428 isoform X3 [Dermacentor variabilis]|uniref:uncharacterized protein LOC142575428 isoform X3 n=1 Tax=Dermacentor variabilis TaxID=34621 RepID=UPI003F5B58AE